jgi:hypothetical protein
MMERIQVLDELGSEFARVAAEVERASRRRSTMPARVLAVALGLVVLLGGAAYAVPATRTAVGGVIDSFATWVAGDNAEAPGRALQPGDDFPGWMRAGGEARVIASNGGVKLYVSSVESDEGPWLWFGLGERASRATGDTLERWQERLGTHSVVVLGEALVGPRDVLDDQGRFALLGITAPDVEQVELRYFEGAPLISEVGDGGFVALPDAWRRLREIVAFDDAGRVVGRQDLRQPDSTYLCEKEPEVCPPGDR